LRSSRRPSTIWQLLGMFCMYMPPLPSCFIRQKAERECSYNYYSGCFRGYQQQPFYLPYTSRRHIIRLCTLIFSIIASFTILSVDIITINIGG
jgi:hypothetical protein